MLEPMRLFRQQGRIVVALPIVTAFELVVRILEDSFRANFLIAVIVDHRCGFDNRVLADNDRARGSETREKQGS